MFFIPSLDSIVAFIFPYVCLVSHLPQFLLVSPRNGAWMTDQEGQMEKKNETKNNQHGKKWKPTGKNTKNKFRNGKKWKTKCRDWWYLYKAKKKWKEKHVGQLFCVWLQVFSKTVWSQKHWNAWQGDYVLLVWKSCSYSKTISKMWT